MHDFAAVSYSPRSTSGELPIMSAQTADENLSYLGSPVEAPPTAANRRRYRLGPEVAIAGSLGLVLRIVTALSHQGAFNSDEAVSGLTSISALKGEFPFIYPGNDYGGVLEAYVYAPFVFLLRAFGPVSWGARVLDAVNICLHAVLFAVLFIIIKRTANRTAAFVCLLFPWILSASFARLASESYLGYVAGAMASIVALYFAVRYETERSTKNSSERYLFASSILAGVAFWQHPLAGIFPICVLAFLGVLDLTVKSTMIRAFRRWFLASLFVTLGALPELVRLVERRHDLRITEAPRTQPFFTRFTAVFTLHIPKGLGLRAANGNWLHPAMDSWVPFVIGVVTIAAALVVLLKGPRCLSALPLGLVLFAALSQTSFTEDGRYALFIVPGLLLLVATATSKLRLPGKLVGDKSVRRLPHSGNQAGLAILAGVVAAIASVSMRGSLTNFQAQNESEVIDIVKFLDSKKITSVRGYYWIVYRIAYVTSERIAASDFVYKRIDRLERRVASSPPQQLAWISAATAAQPAEVTANPDWPSQLIGSYRVYWYAPGANTEVLTTTPS